MNLKIQAIIQHIKAINTNNNPSDEEHKLTALYKLLELEKELKVSKKINLNVNLLNIELVKELVSFVVDMSVIDENIQCNSNRCDINSILCTGCKARKLLEKIDKKIEEQNAI